VTPTGRRLLMWDVDRTLLQVKAVTGVAFATAFSTVTGLEYLHPELEFAGRTDRFIAQQVFAAHGIGDPAPYLDEFFELFTTECASRQHTFVTGGRLMPGIGELIPALARHPGVVQTVVTGNIPATAALKLAAFGLAEHLDVGVGGYGRHDVGRAALVTGCLTRAAERYGDFTDAVVIGDTRHDIEAALAAGVTAVGVATGPLDSAALWAAGAHHVFESFADVPAALALLATGDLTADRTAAPGSMPAGGRPGG
jgi:phosphoglycolate phosphatase